MKLAIKALVEAGIDEIAMVDLSPGAVIIARVPDTFTRDQADLFQRHFTALFQRQVVAVPRSVELAVGEQVEA